MVPVAQETTANTVRLPYSFSRRFSLVAWCEASLEILHVHPLSLSVLQELQRGLRAILRQDPDVVMVGEIRDTETAEIAVQASLTGHLVLSTLHTNTAVGAITRLQDMGVEPFLLSSSLTGVMAQRLVRTLCPDCRQPAPATDEEKRLLGITDARTVTLYHPQGCPACNHKGFRGRTAIHELIVVDATLRDLIHRQAGELELERYVRQHSAGIRSNGIEKVLAGETSLDEVLRVTMEA
ncbi:GspE/PulE family protein [Escherichia coli]